MKKEKFRNFLFLLACLSFGLPSAYSQTVSTPVVGFTSTTIMGTGSSGSSQFFSLVPLQLAKTPSFSGAVTAAGTTLTLSSGSLTSGTYNSGASYPAYYVRVEAGSGAGRTSDIVSNTTSTLTTADDLSAFISTSTQISIVPHTKLTDVLGVSGSQVIAGGSGANTADNIYLVGSDGSFKIFYYKTGVGSGLKTQSNADATGLVVYPGEAILVGRRQTSNTAAVVVTGQLPSTNSVVPITQGFNATGGGVPVAFTLSQLTSLVQGGSGSSTADNVFLIDPTDGQMKLYYYKTGVGAGWKNAANTTVSSSTDISAGFVIQRRPSTGFDIVQSPTW